MDTRRRTLPGGLPFSYVFVPVVAAAVVLAGLGLISVIDGSSGSDGASGPVAGEPADQADSMESGSAVPAFILEAPSEVQVAYQFVAARPDVMMWIPCYCGCGGHSGHLSARNCFVKEGSTASSMQFDSHGSGCDMCVGIALDTKAMVEEGRPLREIRDYIDATYGDLGPSTDTPLPPA